MTANCGRLFFSPRFSRSAARPSLRTRSLIAIDRPRHTPSALAYRAASQALSQKITPPGSKYDVPTALPKFGSDSLLMKSERRLTLLLVEEIARSISCSAQSSIADLIVSTSIRLPGCRAWGRTCSARLSFKARFRQERRRSASLAVPVVIRRALPTRIKPAIAAVPRPGAAPPGSAPIIGSRPSWTVPNINLRNAITRQARSSRRLPGHIRAFAR